MGKEELRHLLEKFWLFISSLCKEKTCFAFYYVLLIEQEESSVVVYLLVSLLASAAMETAV